MKAYFIIFGFSVVLFGITCLFAQYTHCLYTPGEDHLPKNEVHLLSRHAYSIARSLAKKYDSNGTCTRVDILSKPRIVCPVLHLNIAVTIDQSRKISFELVQEYRKMFAANKEVQEFYREHYPTYTIATETLPLENTDLEVIFFENEQVCPPPFICKMLFRGKEFYYYIQQPNSDTFACVFRESYTEAEANYNLRKI